MFKDTCNESAKAYALILCYLSYVSCNYIISSDPASKYNAVDCSAPSNDESTTAVCGTSPVQMQFLGFTDHLGSVRDALQHCANFGRNDSINGIVGGGAGGCKGTSADGKCIYYSTCRLTMRKKNKVGFAHREFGGFIIVTEPTIVDSFLSTQYIEFGLIKKDSMFRACPVQDVPSEFYMEGTSSLCTYNYANSDRVDIRPLPITSVAAMMIPDKVLLPDNINWISESNKGGEGRIEGSNLVFLLNSINERIPAPGITSDELAGALGDRFHEKNKTYSKEEVRNLVADVLIASEICADRICRYFYYGNGRYITIVLNIVILLSFVAVCFGILARIAIKVIQARLPRANQNTGEDVI